MDAKFLSFKEVININTIPIAIEAVFIVSCFVLPKEIHIYTNTAFYLLLFVYFWVRKDFSFRIWGAKLKSGFKFWRATAFTVVGFGTAFAFSFMLADSFSEWSTGSIQLLVDSWPKLFCFTASTIIFPAIVEETFFRKNIISMKSNGSIVITAFIGMLLFGAEHFLMPWGIIIGMIWSLPLSLSYIKTKDVYIPITAHFIVSILGNGLDVISLFQKLL